MSRLFLTKKAKNGCMALVSQGGSDMITLDHKNDYMYRMYEHADAKAKEKCDIYATCSTCRFACIPIDYEKTGYHCYCIRQIRK